MGELLLEESILKCLFVCSSLLILKILLMAPLTARWRYSKKMVISPEDKVLVGKDGKVKNDDPDIERVRRAHLNDLENIPIFIITAILYGMTKPSPVFANALIIFYTAARLTHTIVYAVHVIPQPARFLSFTAALLVNVYMAVSVISYTKD